jgi:K+-transporting ATPase c subunit
MLCVRPALVSLVLTLLTGVAYPLLVTGIAQGLFPSRRAAASCATGARRSAPR